MADQSTVEMVISSTMIAGVAVLVIRGWMRKRAALGWPVTQGKVLWTTVSFTNTGEPGSSRYVAHVRYTYVVEGVHFSGDFRRPFLRRDSADDWAGDYQNGRSLVVRYKPGKPADSVFLEREQTNAAIV